MADTGVARRSPLKMRQVDGRVYQSSNPSAAVSTPLRQSLLKSSKIRSSPLAQDSTFTSNETDDNADMSDDPDERHTHETSQNET